MGRGHRFDSIVVTAAGDVVSAQIRRSNVIRGPCTAIGGLSEWIADDSDSTHIANPIGRVVPLNRDEYDYGPFFKNLKKIGYEGRLSVETGAPEFSRKAPQSIAFLRSAFSQ